MTKRILVTGSRNWSDWKLVKDVLVATCKNDENITIVSGDCPTGADRIATDLAEMRGWKIEKHPANWEVYGKAAGPIRNKRMVELGADICLAFIRDGSAGATHTANLTKKAGIETLVYDIHTQVSP